MINDLSKLLIQKLMSELEEIQLCNWLSEINCIRKMHMCATKIYIVIFTLTRFLCCFYRSDKRGQSIGHIRVYKLRNMLPLLTVRTGVYYVSQFNELDEKSIIPKFLSLTVI